MQKKLKLPKDSKLTKIWHETIYDVYCLYKKFWSQISIRSSHWLQISTSSLQLSVTYSEMASICKQHTCLLLRILLNFYHSLHVWYHDIMISWQISWFLDFICFLSNFKTIQLHVRGHVSWTRYSNFPLNSSTIFQIIELNNMNIIFLFIILY